MLFLVTCIFKIYNIPLAFFSALCHCKLLNGFYTMETSVSKRLNEMRNSYFFVTLKNQALYESASFFLKQLKKYQLKTWFTSWNWFSNIIIFGTKYDLFFHPHQIDFFLAFGHAKIFFSYHIVLNILIYIFYDKKISIFHTENYHWLQTKFQNKKRTCSDKMSF